MKSNNIVFFGTADFSVPSLKALIENGWPIAAVITKPDTPRGRGQKLEPPIIKVIAEEARIPVLQPAKASDILPSLKNYPLEVGVVVAYGKILPQEVLDAFTFGLVNIHASLLPKYRGPSPIEAALLNGDGETGISLMQIAPEMDKGDVYAQDVLPLNGQETRPQLYQTLAERGAKCLAENLSEIISGELSAQPQDEAKAIYTKLISKADSAIDWSWSADKIARHIRAYLSWPGTKAEIAHREVTITDAEVIKKTGYPGQLFKTPGGIGIFCGKDALLIKELQPAGRNVMSGSAFAAGLSRTTFEF